MTLKTISERNPDLDEMRERGWAWVQVEPHTGKYGAPYTDDEYAEFAELNYRDPNNPQRGELRIISFE